MSKFTSTHNGALCCSPSIVEKKRGDLCYLIMRTRSGLRMFEGMYSEMLPAVAETLLDNCDVGDSRITISITDRKRTEYTDLLSHSRVSYTPSVLVGLGRSPLLVHEVRKRAGPAVMARCVDHSSVKSVHPFHSVYQHPFTLSESRMAVTPIIPPLKKCQHHLSCHCDRRTTQPVQPFRSHCYRW